MSGSPSGTETVPSGAIVTEGWAEDGTQESPHQPGVNESLLVEVRGEDLEVADVAGVTEVTIRNRYKELLDKLKLDKEIKKVKKRKKE